MHEPAASPERPPADSFEQALDALLQAWSAGSDLRRDELLARFPGLGAEVDAVVELAREIAVVRPPVLPSIPGYEVLAEVGRGGMGVVYRARQHGVDRVVALKVLPEAFGVDARGRARFLAEARGLGRIRHDHVVTIHGVIETSDVVAYAMEWVDGRSLASLLEELAGWSRRAAVPAVHFGGAGSARLPDPAVPWFARLGVALGRALGEVHRHGLVHRDVKPGNVLLRGDGTALLSDFGLVRAEASGLTRTGQVVGTPAFAAPEQLRGDGDGVGPLSDVFALGATLHCALAGEVPFAGRSALELLANIEARRRRPLTEWGLPKDLETIVARCVEAEPKDRYASADLVADDLENLLALRPVLARPLGVLARGWRLVRRNRRLVVAGAVSGVVVLAACVLLGLWLWSLVTLPARFDARLLAARFALLEPTHEERVELAQMGKGPERASVFATSGEQALAAYQEALALDGSRRDVANERDVVQLALQLLRQEVLAPAATLRAVAPTACAAAMAWHEGREFEFAASESVPASVADRRALGLLAFLTGRVNVCHEAWQDLELAGDPFIDAASGQMHLQRGEIAKAYARLSRAAQVWSEAGFLAVALADCAVREGDLAVAERELGRAGRLGLKDPFDTHVRVKADLRAAQGRVEEAQVLYEWVIANHYANTARAHYLSMLERIGDFGRALDLRLDALERGRQDNVEDVLLEAKHWWAHMSDSQQIEELTRCWQLPVGQPSRLERLPSALKRSFGNTTTLEHGTSSGESRVLLFTPQLSLLQEFAAMPTSLKLLLTRFPSARRPLASMAVRISRAACLTYDSALLVRRVSVLVQPASAAIFCVLAVSESMTAQVQWTNVTPGGSSPTPRRYAAASFDDANGVGVHFGGLTDATAPATYFGDTWIWNGAFGQWTQVVTATAPSPRYGASMSRAAGGGVLLFGGRGTTSDFGDTWLWNGTFWTQLTPATSPSGRSGASMAFDSVRGVVVLYGGYVSAGGSGPQADTWEWNGVTWTNVSPPPASSPPPSSGHRLVFDRALARTLMFGGASGPSTPLNQTWLWDGTQWANVPTTSSPSPRYYPSVAWDDTRSCVLLHGGITTTGTLADVWEFVGVPSSSPPSGQWLLRTPVPGASPGAVGASAVFYDSVRSEVIIFSGWQSGTTHSPFTWSYSPVNVPFTTVTGAGCNPASPTIPTLSRVPGYGPWVGGQLRLQVDGLPPTFPTFPFLIVGFTNPGLPLAGLSAPSCTLRANPDFLFGLGSPATWSLTIPNTQTLYGAQLFAQEVSLNLPLPVGSPGWIAAMSNGLGFTIGSR